MPTIEEAYRLLQDVTRKLALTANDHEKLAQCLGLLYQKAQELEDIKAEEKDGGTDISVLDTRPDSSSS